MGVTLGPGVTDGVGVGVPVGMGKWGSEWACIDLTDSGLRVKTRKEAHMKTQLSKPARSKARYTDQYERFLKKE